MSSKIKHIEVKLFAVPLQEALNDAKHGDHTHFQLVTSTVTLEDGSEGTGYTYTGGKGGHAIKSHSKSRYCSLVEGKRWR